MSKPLVAGREAGAHRMQELTDPRWIKIKGLLFLFLGLGSAGLLLLDRFNLKDAALLSIAVWCFCRFYYFAFYVIERYVDPAFRFSGLWAFAGYLWGRRRDRESTLRADVR